MAKRSSVQNARKDVTGFIIVIFLIIGLLIFYLVPLPKLNPESEIQKRGPVECKVFEEQVVWSSGYGNKPGGVTNYQTWNLQRNCSETGATDCFLGNVKVQTRLRSFENGTPLGFIQISNSDETVCEHPEAGEYLTYLTHTNQSPLTMSCESSRDLNGTCTFTLSEAFENTAPCYGIKAYATEESILDALSVQYKLCWSQNE